MTNEVQGCCCSVTKLCPTLSDTTAWSCLSPPATLYFTISWSSLKLMSTESLMPFNQLILCCPLLLLPSISSTELVLSIKQQKYWSFSFSISPFNEYSGLISFRIDWFHLCTKRLLRVFSSTMVRKHQFFGTQPSLWFNSHIHTWLLEKP